jgi:hypothetical protein
VCLFLSVDGQGPVNFAILSGQSGYNLDVNSSGKVNCNPSVSFESLSMVNVACSAPTGTLQVYAYVV